MTIEVDLNRTQIDLNQFGAALYSDTSQFQVKLPDSDAIDRGHQKLMQALENRETIYGVTTGFGGSSKRIISPENAVKLQKNLITYLTCGIGKALPQAVCRATVLLRLHSLSRGYSAVSFDLLKRLKWMVEENVTPVIPSQGSLGASGDLVPLAYLARAVQGEGEVWHKGQKAQMPEVLRQYDLPPYELKPKEGLALVNGTTVMAAYSLHNLKIIEYLMEMSFKSTALCIIGMNGRADAFNPLINSIAKQFPGQSLVASRIYSYLNEEGYQTQRHNRVDKNEERREAVQDKYSLRCAPQILGPVWETLEKSKEWTGLEGSGVSDNPIIDDGDDFSMGGNFYGGYISQAMDSMKLGMAHWSDMLDRQFMCLIDEATNRGLPPNLADWQGLGEDQQFANHGLKGLNQAMSAITSEVMAQSVPGGIYSRSSEAHNQDKVSLGLSTCIQMENMFDNLFNILSIHLLGCVQAIDLRGVSLKGNDLKPVYDFVRRNSDKVVEDRALDQDILRISNSLKKQSGAYNEFETL